MGLGRKRARAELLDAVRGELDTARSDLHSALAEVVGGLERRLHTRLDERDRSASSVASDLESMGSELGARVAQFERALERVAETCDLAVQTVQTNRVERIALLQAIEGLAARLPDAVEPPPAGTGGGGGLKVVGGTVGPKRIDGPDGTDEPARADETSRGDMDARAEVVAAHPAGASRQVIRLDGVEVRCRFDGDHWVSGFEVSEVIREDDGIQYRLRRRADGYELPRLFAAIDVRDVDPPHLREVPRR
jgi:hypothetical protein